MSETTVHGPGGEIVVRNPAQALVARVRSEEFKEQVALALPSGESADRFTRVMVTALLENPDLAVKAEHGSILQAGIKAAQDGLLPDGREAAFVLFNNKKKGITEAQYLPMIGGFRKIAAESDWTIRTQVVYENDEFAVEMGMVPSIIHRPVRPGVERGPMVAAYAVGAHKDGRLEIEVMSAADIAKVKATSRAAAFGPWKDWEERMWEKTVGRRLFKKLPLGDRDAARVARVIEASVIEPEDSVEQLYGSEARAALMSPEGFVVSEYVAVEGRYEEFGDSGLVAETMSSASGGHARAVGTSPDSGSEADAANALGAADDHPPVERSASDQSAGGEVSDVVAPDSERPAAVVPEAPPAEIPEPVIAELVSPPADPRLLAQARKAKPPLGSYQDKTLDIIVRMPQASEWLVYALGKWPEETAFGRLLWCVVRSDRPELVP